jgi:ABC-type spermidine/putrescine transport system permease subunit II
MASPQSRDAAAPASAEPSVASRALALAAIVIAGVCGGLIGWALADLQYRGNGLVMGIAIFVGALILAGGVAVVAVLVLRAMTEWQTIQEDRRTGQPTRGIVQQRPSRSRPPRS